METRRPQTDGATLEFGGGSFGTWMGGGSVELAREGYGLYLGIHSLKTSGDFKFLDDNGTAWVSEDDKVVPRQNNRVHDLDGAVRGFVALPGQRELSLLGLGFDRDQGIPGYPIYPMMQPALRTRRGIGSIAYSSHDEVGDNSLLRAQLYGYALEQRFRDPLGELVNEVTDVRARTFALGGTVRTSHAVTSWLTPAALLDVRRESTSPRDLLTGQQGMMSTRLLTVAGAESAFRIASLGLALIPSLRLRTSRDESPPNKALVRTLPIARRRVHEVRAR